MFEKSPLFMKRGRAGVSDYGVTVQSVKKII